MFVRQKVLEEVVNADAGAPCSVRHHKKKMFIEQLKKALVPHAASG
jgi:neurofibromin 1